MLNFDIKKQQGKTKNRVGLDIGSHSVKVMEVSDASSEKPRLVSLSLKRVADRSPKAAIDAIKEAVGAAKLSTKDVAIALSGASVIVRFVLMPKMTDAELSSAIKFEAEKFIPFNINECAVDFKVIKKEERENKLNVLFVAAKKELIDEKLAVAEEAGLSVKVVDVEGFALTNVFLRNFPSISRDKNYALLDIGAKITNLSIVRNGEICLIRDMAVGSADFTSAIANSMHIDPKMAEEMKLDPKDKLKDILSCTRPVFNNLLDEMRLPLSYYENQCGGSVDEIYVSGGGAGITGLENVFQEGFGLKPIMWNPLQFLDVSESNVDASFLDKMRSSFAIAAGLVLRET